MLQVPVTGQQAEEIRVAMQTANDGNFENIVNTLLREHRTKEDVDDLYQACGDNARRAASTAKERESRSDDGDDLAETVSELRLIAMRTHGRPLEEFRRAVELPAGDLLHGMDDRELEEMRQQLILRSHDESQHAPGVCNELLCSKCAGKSARALKRARKKSRRQPTEQETLGERTIGGIQCAEEADDADEAAGAVRSTSRQ